MSKATSGSNKAAEGANITNVPIPLGNIDLSGMTAEEISNQLTQQADSARGSNVSEKAPTQTDVTSAAEAVDRAIESRRKDARQAKNTRAPEESQSQKPATTRQRQSQRKQENQDKNAQQEKQVAQDQPAPAAQPADQKQADASQTTDETYFEDAANYEPASSPKTKTRKNSSSSSKNKTRRKRVSRSEPVEEAAPAAENIEDITEDIEESVSESSETTGKKYTRKRQQRSSSAQRQISVDVSGQMMKYILPKDWEHMSNDQQVRWLQKKIEKSRQKMATQRNEGIDPVFDEVDYEAFANDIGSMMDSHYRSNKEFFDEENEKESAFLDTSRKAINKRQARLMDKVRKAFKRGYFPLAGQHVSIDGKGVARIEWSKPTEDAMNGLIQYLGLHKKYSEVDCQRCIFRLVLLYSCISVDRKGRLFNESSEKWMMSEDDFRKFCDMIYKSCTKFGHPMAMPQLLGISDTKYMGRQIYPSGVVPMSVASMLMHEESPLINKEAGMIDGLDLQRRCREEWNERTHPTMITNLRHEQHLADVERSHRSRRSKLKGEEKKREKTKKNPISQLIVCEDIQWALARLDGIEDQIFADEYNVDIIQHNKMSEYLDSNAEYATIMNGNYNAEEINRRQEEKIALAERLYEKRRGPKTVFGHKLPFSDGKLGPIEAAVNLLTAAMKTNALFLNFPILGSSIVEKGVGDLQTHLTIKAISKKFDDAEQFTVSEELINAFKTSEASKAIDAACILLEIGGPQALIMFAESGNVLSQEAVVKWLEDNVYQYIESPTAKKISKLNRKLDKVTQKVLAGNMAFKKKSNLNFLNGFLASNQVLFTVQQRLAAEGREDAYSGPVFTGAEINEIFLGNNRDITRFITECIRTNAGRDGLLQMRSNNIASINPVSYQVGQVLRAHGITNFVITTWVDTFVRYGINFLHAITPMSRTIDYLACKGLEWQGNGLAADLVIGGGMGARTEGAKFKDDIGFYEGLIMNLYYDAASLKRWSYTAALIGCVLAAIGFDPPDEDEDLLNISMWKIGSRIGLGEDRDGDGKGDGIEIMNAYWINDLTQLGLPGGYVIALALTTMDPSNDVDLSVKQIAALFSDSMFDQVDGNVVLDVVDGIKNLTRDEDEYEKLAFDPTYETDEDTTWLGAWELLFIFGNKITPGAPIYRSIGNSALWRGPDALAHTPNYVFDKSDEWTTENEILNYVNDPYERLLRKYSMSNYMLAGWNNLMRNWAGPDHGLNKTGYFWWEMPYRQKAEPLALVMYQGMKMDYDNLPKGVTREQYEVQRTEDLLRIISSWSDEYGGPEGAARNGCFIPSPIRYAAADVLYSEINALKNDFDAKDAAGWFPSKDAKYDYLNQMNQTIDDYYDIINDWLKNDNIPTWYESYEQYLSDWEQTYVHADGTPATKWEHILNPTVQEKWKLKGNSPTAVLPFTVVNTGSNENVQRGWNAETIPYWYKEGVTDLEGIKQAYGNSVINIGKDMGRTIFDVEFGENIEGELQHPDEPTIGERAWVGKKYRIDSKLKNLSEDNCSGSIYGDLGKKASDGSSGSSSSTGSASSGSSNKTTDDSGAAGEAYDDSSLGAGSGINMDTFPAFISGLTGSALSSIVGDKGPGSIQTTIGPFNRFGTTITPTGGKNDSPSYYPKRTYARRSGGSSYSSNYTPNIYSNPHSINADRPSTMYSKTPYSTRNNSYLRPSFSTKGSREAYKRQDF